MGAETYKNKKNFLCQWAQALTKIKKISCEPSGPDLLGRRPYPGGLKPKTRKPIGNLGHAIDFRAIGNLGNDLDFVNIGILGNCSDIAKIANDFGWLHAFGGGEGEKPQLLAILARLSSCFS